MYKRLWAALLACTLAFSCAIVPADATGTTDGKEVIVRATGQINHTIPANTLISVEDWISLDKGEQVRFNCAYVSKSASVDFGLIDADNVFHYQRCTSGSISQSIKIEEAGQYIVAIRNNESYDITVTGNIRY